MKKILVLAYLSFGIYKYGPLVTGGNEVVPLYDHPYVIVYGRDSCGWTSFMRKQLVRSGIPFEYRIVDDWQVAEPLQERMAAAGLDVRRYSLPVVDVSGLISIRPEPQEVISEYRL